MKRLLFFFGLTLVISNSSVRGYGLPSLNLGLNNPLDGGALRAKPGWYWYEFFTYHHAIQYLDGHGNPRGGVPSPEVNTVSLLNEVFYETYSHPLFGARLGFDASLSTVLSSHVTKNNALGLRTSGAGVGDLRLSTYLQWNPIFYHGRPISVNRLLFGVILPTGKNEQPCKGVNPGANEYAFNPYWSSTFYMTPDWSVSWRWYYLWVSQNKKTGIQPGQAMHINYNMDYKCNDKWHVGLNGYFLRQLRDNRLCGVSQPASREQVVGFGPGFFYYAPHEFIFFLHVYGEFAVLNRAKGVQCVLRFIKHF